MNEKKLEDSDTDIRLTQFIHQQMQLLNYVYN